MGEPRGDGHLSPGSQPRAARRLLSPTEEDRERIERRLERMPLEREALLLAMGQFGANFDLDEWLVEYGVKVV